MRLIIVYGFEKFETVDRAKTSATVVKNIRVFFYIIVVACTVGVEAKRLTFCTRCLGKYFV